MVRELTLAGIAHRCARETELFFQRLQHDTRFCLELFRQAIVDRHHRAWELVYTQYHPLVVGWVTRHAAFLASGEEKQYFVNRAFEKMWEALTPEKFNHFPDLKGILRYLQMCVHSVIVDYSRQREHRLLLHDTQETAVGYQAPGSAVENQVFKQMQHDELWNCLDQRLKNEKERRVMLGTFVMALKPRELYVQFQGMFRDVREVYRIKENVIARLRRDKELQKLFDDA